MRISIFLILVLLCTYNSYAQDKKAIQQLIERVLPNHYSQIELRHSNKKSDKDWYEIETKNGKVVLKANNNIGFAVALNHYLRNYSNTSFSWTGILEPSTFTKVSNKVNGSTSYDYRLYLNYCTFNYTMSFWDWERWEKEIDWMALRGINMPLAMVGQEAVWQNTLKRLNYTDAEIKEFIAGPAYSAWWLMGNLEGWGGPVPQTWIDGQAELQKKIVERMKSLGMKPVMQGFYGMVPNSLIKKYPSAKMHDPGLWLGFKRPAMLMPTDPLFDKISRIYYEEQEKLYGKTNYYQGDPFHEGGTSEGVDLVSAGEAIYKSMVSFNPNAIWVLQAWQDNPKAALLKNVPKGRAIVTDLNAEARPQWGGHTKHLWNRPNGYEGHDWIWSIIPNFGGRTGMTGRLDSMNIDVNHAINHPIGKASMKGIGAAPEAIGQDEILYDLLYDLAWTKDKLNLDDWLKTYVKSRYGQQDLVMEEAGQRLRTTVYNSSYGLKDPPSETIFCARPEWNKTSSSAWGEWRLDYDRKDLESIWKLAMGAIPNLQYSSNFQYDMVNITRQVLANYGRIIYHDMQKAYEEKNISLLEQKGNQFLELIKDQDRLLSSREEFMLGPWIEAAKKKGSTPQEKKLYEFNARTLVTTWTHELNEVNDYSCREWSGLLEDYYLVRWDTFINNSLKKLKNENVVEPDYFDFEKKWANATNTYPTKPTEKSIDIVKELFIKYDAVINK